MKSNIITIVMSSNTMTDTNVLTSNPIRIDQIYGFAVQVVFTGTPVGTFKLQGSCDSTSRQTQVSNGGPDTVANWTDIADSSQSVSGAGSSMYNVVGAMYNYVRLVYTNTSSTGTITSAKISPKG